MRGLALRVARIRFLGAANLAVECDVDAKYRADPPSNMVMLFGDDTLGRLTAPSLATSSLQV